MYTKLHKVPRYDITIQVQPVGDGTYGVSCKAELMESIGDGGEAKLVTTKKASTVVFGTNVANAKKKAKQECLDILNLGAE